jgi:hypothetical protein
VINFEFPMVGSNASVVYRNRISNLTMTGNAITFFTPRSIDYLKSFISDLCQMKQVNFQCLKLSVVEFPNI